MVFGVPIFKHTMGTPSMGIAGGGGEDISNGGGGGGGEIFQMEAYMQTTL